MRRWLCWLQPHDWRRDPTTPRRVRIGDMPRGPRMRVVCARCGDVRSAKAALQGAMPSEFQCAEVTCWPKFTGEVLKERW